LLTIPPQKDGDIAETLKTTDADGKPLGGVWVGLYPVGKILGAPPTGYHNWSDAQGELKLTGFLPGKYRVAIGGELYGKSVRRDDGSLEFTPSIASASASESSAEP